MKESHNITILAIAILSLSVGYAIHSSNQHRQFFRDVRGFMDRGDRNTAEMGFRMCERLNRHESTHGREPIDCCALYFDGDTEKCAKVRGQ